jgi:AMP phosphorylase
MSHYLRTKKLDITTEDALIFVLHEETAERYGLYPGDRIHACWHDICVYGTVDTTNTLVGYSEIGLYEDVWHDYGIPNDDMVSIDVVSNNKSVEAIEKKLEGGELTYEEINSVIKAISKRKLSSVELTYFVATFYSPGFTEQELYYLTKAMAENGDTLNFKGSGEPVVDKHSIGGIPSKGVTPVIVPILVSLGLIVPNTSSRAVTSPAGTSDVLEVLMPVTLTKAEIEDVVNKTGGCLVWGGGVDLAPADDEIIGVQRSLSIESYDNFIVSIMAKKIATGLDNFLVDLPVGTETKLEHPEDVPLVADHFKRLGKLFDINVRIYERKPKGPDGYGIGPTLEARDLLRVFERHPRRPVIVEEEALNMCAEILEMSGKVDSTEEGYKLAKEELLSGRAEEKFWEMALAQGAKEKKHSDSLILGEYEKVYTSPKSGKIKRISVKGSVELARLLGCPFLKRAGIYFNRIQGEKIVEGEALMTLYSSGQKRLEMGMKFIEENFEELIEWE